MPDYKVPLPIIKDILNDCAPAAPLKAMIHITTNCNLRCEFCWHHSPLQIRQPHPSHASGKEIIRIIRDLAEMGTKAIHLGADGEPTTHPMFMDFVDAIKKCDMHLHFASNFSFRSPKIAAACARADRIILNLAAVDAVSYRAIHHPIMPKTFDQVIKNIEFFSRIQARSGRPKLEVDFVITKNTFRHIEEALHLARTCGIRLLIFRMLRTTPATRHLALGLLERKELKRIVARLIRKPVDIQTNLGELLKTLSWKNNMNPRFNRCFIGWLTININQNGDVGLCCQHNGLNIGNWRNDNIRDIWTCTKAQKLRDRTKNHFDPTASFWRDCRSCLFADSNSYLEQVLKEYARHSR